jgi:hypothetical protein
VRLCRGRHWQAAYENAEIGGVRAIDPGKEAVDGGRLPEVLTDQQRRAVVDLKNARLALGPEGNQLVIDVLAKGWSISCRRPSSAAAPPSGTGFMSAPIPGMPEERWRSGLDIPMRGVDDMSAHMPCFRHGAVICTDNRRPLYFLGY